MRILLLLVVEGDELRRGRGIVSLRRPIPTFLAQAIREIGVEHLAVSRVAAGADRRDREHYDFGLPFRPWSFGFGFKHRSVARPYSRR